MVLFMTTREKKSKENIVQERDPDIAFVFSKYVASVLGCDRDHIQNVLLHLNHV